jgi:hypothetical protein
VLVHFRAQEPTCNHNQKEDLDSREEGIGLTKLLVVIAVFSDSPKSPTSDGEAEDEGNAEEVEASKFSLEIVVLGRNKLQGLVED